MHLFDKNDLRKLICNKEIFSLFNLMERERKILIGHVVNGVTFNILGKLLGDITPQRAHEIYKRALKKMQAQIVGILLDYKKNSQRR
jgi:hypothetical protein